MYFQKITRLTRLSACASSDHRKSASGDLSVAVAVDVTMAVVVVPVAVAAGDVVIAAAGVVSGVVVVGTVADGSDAFG